MTCSLALEGDRAERYLEGDLSAEEQAAFEDHYFECDDCFRAVQALESLPGALARRARPRRALWAQYPTAAVALLAVSALTLVWQRSSGRRSGPDANGPNPPAPAARSDRQTNAPAGPALQGLADVEPPLYVPLLLRGQDARRDARFDRAMGRYAQGDYRGAAEGLRGLADERAAGAELLFFLGVSELAAGETKAALAALGKCAEGGTPYEAPARYYLAQAHIVRSDPDAARTELRAVMRLGGAYLERARRALTRLDEAAPPRG